MRICINNCEIAQFCWKNKDAVSADGVLEHKYNGPSAGKWDYGTDTPWSTVSVPSSQALQQLSIIYDFSRAVSARE